MTLHYIQPIYSIHSSHCVPFHHSTIYYMSSIYIHTYLHTPLVSISRRCVPISALAPPKYTKATKKSTSHSVSKRQWVSEIAVLAPVQPLCPSFEPPGDICRGSHSDERCGRTQLLVLGHCFDPVGCRLGCSAALGHPSGLGTWRRTGRRGGGVSAAPVFEHGIFFAHFFRSHAHPFRKHGQ